MAFPLKLACSEVLKRQYLSHEEYPCNQKVMTHPVAINGHRTFITASPEMEFTGSAKFPPNHEFSWEGKINVWKKKQNMAL
ncbi:MAG: hypothetical protein Tsb0026_10780 [Sulfuricaulis sp.]